MYWQTEMPIVVRSLINDFEENYSNQRILQLITVAAKYVALDLNMDKEYSIDIVNRMIEPDPCDLVNRDDVFVSFVSLRAACFLDQSTFRTKAVTEGITTALGPAKLSVGGNLSGYKTILDVGPCAMYEHLKQQHNIGNATVIEAVLGPFVGNDFDPRYLRMYDNNSRHGRNDFYA